MPIKVLHDDKPYKPTSVKKDIMEACLSWAFSGAKDLDCKKEIVTKAKEFHSEIVAKGDRFCVLFKVELIKEYLKGTRFTTKEIRTFYEVYIDFSREWDNNIQLHHKRLLIEGM